MGHDSFLPQPTAGKSPKRLDDGTYARPRGRCPIGTTWDPIKGQYVLSSTVQDPRLKRKQHKNTGTSNKRDWNMGSKKTASHNRGGRIAQMEAEESDDEAFQSTDRPKKRQKQRREYSLDSSSPAERVRPPRRAMKSTAVSSNSRKEGLEIGSRVYAEFYDGGWYWATIVGITRASDPKHDRFSLYFDDEDEMPDARRDQLRTVKEMLMVCKSPGPMPPATINKLNELAKASKPPATAKSLIRSDRPPPGSLSLRELFLRRCMSCDQCEKPDCGACVSCRRNNSSSGFEREVCVRKMCLEIPDSQKKQRAVGLPEGTTFLFTKDIPRHSSYPHTPGLYITGPKGTKFSRSTDAFLKSHPSFARHNPNAGTIFNQYIGEVDVSSTMSSSHETREESSNSLCRDRTVGSRVYCLTEEKWGTIEEKFQLAGNKFRYSVRLEDGGNVLDDLGEKSIVSEYQYQRKTGLAPPSRPADEESHEPTFQDRMDSSIQQVRVVTDNFLVGRKVLFAWTDLNGQHKTVYGKVTECEYNAQSDEVISCNVVYTRASRSLANSVNNGCGSMVLPSQLLDPRLVVGGALCFEEMPVLAPLARDRLVDYTTRPFRWQWLSPESRCSTMVEDSRGISLPRLALSFRGHELILSVRSSTIRNAGLGVFLSCVPACVDSDCDDSDDDEYIPFRLEAGELLDLGVYAPHYIQDVRSAAAFNTKNFIHSFKCEEWSFDTKGSHDHLDITDDINGDLHDRAKKSVLPHVNETDDARSTTVTPQHDPEGAAHLLLGHAEESQGAFVVPCDGSSMELFMSYGDGYEKVRQRKGYSFLPDEPLDVVTDGDVLCVLNEFGANETKKAVDYLFMVFTKHALSMFTENVLERALLCAVVLARRSKELAVESKRQSNSHMQPPSVNLARVHKLSECVVGMLLDKVDGTGELKLLHAHGNTESLLKQVIKRQSYPTEELDKLDDLML